jgi:hypothetical protein
LARELKSDASDSGVPAGSHLFTRVQKPGGTGKLEPMMIALRRLAGAAIGREGSLA